MEDVVDPTNAKYIGNINLPFQRPEQIPTQSKDDFFRAVQETLSPEEALKQTENSDWRPIFNHSVEELDSTDRVSEVARFSTVVSFNLTTIMQGELEWMGWYRCVLDTCLGQLCSFIGMDKFNDRRLYFPGTGGRFLLTGQDCPPQTGHNDFDNSAGTGPGLFIITTGHEASGL